MKKIFIFLLAMVLVVSLVLVMAAQTVTLVHAASSGPNNGGAFADDDSIGMVPWSNPSNAQTQNNVYATAILTEKDWISHYLKATDFGFTIPSGATIKGIVVEVDRYETAPGQLRVSDNSICLVKGGVISGDNKSTGLPWPNSDTNTYQSYGGSTDLWGLTWTPDDISGSGFGVAISAIKDRTGADATVYVDHIRITVYYNRAPVATSQSGLSVNSCSTLTVTLNGTDSDNDPLTYKISALPTHGDLYDGTGTGGTHITSIPYTVTDVTHKVTYQPNASYSGSDSFGFKVNDGTVDSAEATISITVSASCTTYYKDADDDTYGVTGDTQCLCAPSGQYTATVGGDCDDNDANEHPGQTWYKDADNDLYSDGTTDTTSCARPTGYKVASELTATSGDCDDSNAAVNPGATEVCNGIDDDCDTLIDDADPSCTGKATWYQDSDSDTYGNPNVSQQACSQPQGYVLDNTDCDDNDASVNPGATEVCNGIDDDCDTLVDEGVTTTYYHDGDSDTYGDPNDSTQACTQPQGYVLDNTDCDDNDANEHPGQTWYKDADNDLYSDGTTDTTSCARPTGYRVASELTATSGDCDDSNAAVNPGATEVCNGIDDDCDTLVDEGVTTTYYHDGDSDTYGDPNDSTQTCSQTQGYVLDNTDCDDNDANVNPGATEVPYNGKDDDCNPATPDAVYDLTMAAAPEEGGTATDLTNNSPYAEGAEVSIKAEAAGGYRFVEWTAPVGVFGNATAAETTFTMPAQNVTVTANFEEIPPPPVYPTVTTQAATEVTTNSATPNMIYTVGNYTSVDVCFAYKKSTDSAWSSTGWVSKSANGTYATPLTGLSSNTKYDFKAQLKYDTTVIEGATLQFTTATSSIPPVPPIPPRLSCFIATAAYGTPTAKQIDVLREFRDVVLLKSTAGSQFVSLYYQLSPPIADFIAGNEFLRTLVRELLVDPIVWVVEATGDIWRN